MCPHGQLRLGIHTRKPHGTPGVLSACPRVHPTRRRRRRRLLPRPAAERAGDCGLSRHPNPAPAALRLKASQWGPSVSARVYARVQCRVCGRRRCVGCWVGSGAQAERISGAPCGCCVWIPSRRWRVDTPRWLASAQDVGAWGLGFHLDSYGAAATHATARSRRGNTDSEKMQRRVAEWSRSLGCEPEGPSERDRCAASGLSPPVKRRRIRVDVGAWGT